MKRALAAAFALLVAVPALRADVTEPKSGTTFAEKQGDLRLLGVGLRTKTMLKVKVYAIGLYVAESAAAGLKAKAGNDLYNDLVWGDYPKEVRMKFVRDVSADQIRDAFAESLGSADASRRQEFLGYFTEIKSGQEIVLRWGPGGRLETTVAGQSKPPIADKNFAATVFGIWLGASPIQDDIKRDLVARK